MTHLLSGYGRLLERKPGDGLSKIGPSNCSPGAARECALKTRVNAHAQCANFLFQIALIYLWLAQCANPCQRRSRGGGRVAGATPPFWGWCVPVPPFQCALRGYMDAPQMGGALPPQ